MKKNIFLMIALILTAGSVLYGDDVLYVTEKDGQGNSLYKGEGSAQGGLLGWSMTLEIEDKRQKVITSLRGEPMSRQSRSAIITHGTRNISDNIKAYLHKNKGENYSEEKEQVNQAKDFMEKTLRDILNAPRMSDLKAKSAKKGKRRKKYPHMGINIDIVIFGDKLTVVNLNDKDAVYFIGIPDGAVGAFVEEMRMDAELGRYVVEAESR